MPFPPESRKQHSSRGNSSTVERQLPKLKVAGSNPVSRSNKNQAFTGKTCKGFSRGHIPWAHSGFSATDLGGGMPQRYAVFRRAERVRERETKRFSLTYQTGVIAPPKRPAPSAKTVNRFSSVRAKPTKVTPRLSAKATEPPVTAERPTRMRNPARNALAQ